MIRFKQVEPTLTPDYTSSFGIYIPPSAPFGRFLVSARRIPRGYIESRVEWRKVTEHSTWFGVHVYFPPVVVWYLFDLNGKRLWPSFVGQPFDVSCVKSRKQAAQVLVSVTGRPEGQVQVLKPKLGPWWKRQLPDPFAAFEDKRSGQTDNSSGHSLLDLLANGARRVGRSLRDTILRSKP